MRRGETLWLAWRAITTHRLRAVLTTLGVVIGIGAVVALVSLGASLQADVLGQVASDDTASLYVWAGPDDPGRRPGSGAQPVFTDQDVAALAETDGVGSVVPYSVHRADHLLGRNQTVTRSGTVRVTVPSYLAGEPFAAGRNFRVGQREAVLTPTAAAMWEPALDVGDRIGVVRANSTRTVTVVGILNDSTPVTAFEGFSDRPRIYTAPEAVGERSFLLVLVRASDPHAAPEVAERVRTYLRDRSDARTALPADYVFNVQTESEARGELQELLSVLTGTVTGIALISLFVGAIGIANIMLVSVTERTREIGIMKAVGAQRRDILALFLVEAAGLGLLGAVVGTTAGVGVGFVAAQVIGFDAYVVPVEWAAVAVVVGIGVGALAGLYPAWTAARTEPIAALRYE